MSGDPDAAMLARMAAALQAMPPRQRVILLAVRHDQASYEQLAEHFGLTVAQVEDELAGALVALSDAADGHALSWPRLLLRWHRRHGQR